MSTAGAEVPAERVDSLRVLVVHTAGEVEAFVGAVAEEVAEVADLEGAKASLPALRLLREARRLLRPVVELPGGAAAEAAAGRGVMAAVQDPAFRATALYRALVDEELVPQSRLRKLQEVAAYALLDVQRRAARIKELAQHEQSASVLIRFARPLRTLRVMLSRAATPAFPPPPPPESSDDDIAKEEEEEEPESSEDDADQADWSADDVDDSDIYSSGGSDAEEATQTGGAVGDGSAGAGDDEREADRLARSHPSPAPLRSTTTTAARSRSSTRVQRLSRRLTTAQQQRARARESLPPPPKRCVAKWPYETQSRETADGEAELALAVGDTMEVVGWAPGRGWLRVRMQRSESVAEVGIVPANHVEALDES